MVSFQLEGRGVRGRLMQLGPLADTILGSHDYPDPVRELLGEAIMIAVLIGSSLKIDGRLQVQATGNGPVSMLLAEYHTDGGVRGYAGFDAGQVAGLSAAKPSARALLGDGQLAMTIDRGPEFDRYQSLVPLVGNTLGEATEHYFNTSEQLPTRVKLAVAALRVPGRKEGWRMGGAILQPLAGDSTRGDTREDWDYGRALFDTLELAELVDPSLSIGQLLFRLFHEDGVRLFPPQVLSRHCPCEREMLAKLVASFPRDDRAEMKETDGRVRVTCEYCSRHFLFTDSEIDAAGGAMGKEFTR